MIVMSVSTWGDVFTLNAIAGGPQNTSVEALQDGRFLTTWQEVSTRNGVTDGFAIRAQILNADGSVAAPAFRVNDIDGMPVKRPAVAVLANGEFVVTYEQYDPTTWSRNLVVHRYEANGTSIEALARA
jgi:hypothetical protein